MFYNGKHLFTAESTFRGHPDKVCDQIADAILDEFLANDQNARTAIEVMIYPNKVIIAGETYANFNLSNTQIDFIVRDTLMKIGYTKQKSFAWDNVNVSINLSRQSPEIVYAAGFATNAEKASDQGLMFGYAINHNDILMPDPIYYAHLLIQAIEAFIEQQRIEGLGPDGKCQITFECEGNRIVGVKTVIVSIMHSDNFNSHSIKDLLCDTIISVFSKHFTLNKDSIFVNPSGSFKMGGPESDVGLTGRKLMVDTYGGYVMHGGGAFSGKDPSKLDRAGAYAMRHLAKNIVAAGMAEECLIQIAYAIGIKDPISFFVETGNINLNEKLQSELPKLYDLSPYGIRKKLSLNKPIYLPTSFYGHFGRRYKGDGFFTWEKLDFISNLQEV